MKKFVTIFKELEWIHLGKDVFLTPYYLGKKIGAEVEIVFPQSETNKELPSVIRGVHLHPIKQSHIKFFSVLKLYWYIFRNAKHIAYFMRFHKTSQSMMQIILYKFLNKQGKAYLKLDSKAVAAEQIPNKTGLKGKLNGVFHQMYINAVDLVSVETFEAFHRIMYSKNYQWAIQDKLVYMQNGFDEEELQKLPIREKVFSEKDNLIITVGRIGTYQKNSQLFLDALKGVDLKDWKVLFVGPVDEKFQPAIDKFYNDCPNQKGKVVFTGAVTEKCKLWSYYNDAKVFVLTSVFEGYPLVFPEAKRFRNFIVSTPVGADRDITEEWKYGIRFESAGELNNILQQIISNEIGIDVYNNFDVHELAWSNMVKNIVL